MSWRMRYIANTLLRKYGPTGYAAGNYVRAGYSVRVLSPDTFTAVKSSDKLIIKIVASYSKALLSEITKFRDMASKLGLKPIVILYGNTNINSEVVNRIKEMGVRVKRLR